MKKEELLGEDVAIVNQILPFRNKWAWDLYLKALENQWNPSSIGMADDIKQWKNNELTADEKLVIKRCLGFFAGTESLVNNNLMINIAEMITSGECRQYIARQIFEEALHNHTIVYICDSLGLNTTELYEAYKNIPSIKAKDDFLMDITRWTKGIDNTRKKKLTNLITYYIICEGIFFFSGFAILLSFSRRNLLPGICTQIKYTLKDETLHLEFGTKLINQIRKEYPDLWDKEYEKQIVEHIKKAVELEITYAKDILPRGILGLNSALFIEYMHFMANLRLASLNIDYKFPAKRNPFEWMFSEIESTQKENFFETHPTEYKTGGLEDDY